MTPTFEVLVFFGLTPTASTTFTLDDPTRGLLDDVYELGGDTGTDVTADMVNIRVDRGRRSPIFTDIDAGQVRVTLNNEDRTYDPLHTAGPYYGLLTLGKRVRILANSVVIFDGRISDWELTYDVSGRSVAEFVAEDALATLARKTFDDWTATASQTAGPRLTSVLNRTEVAWPGGQRDLDTGIATLQGDAVSWGSSVLNYCQLVAKSDGPAAFFASREGLVTFRDRRANLTGPSVVTFADTNHGPSGTSALINGIGITVGSEEFYTRVSVRREGGTVQSYTSATAGDDDVVTLTLNGLLLDSDAQALDYATYYANAYAAGAARVSSVSTTVDDRTMSTAVLAAVLGIEINDKVSISWTPNGVGDPIAETAVVIGIQMDGSPDLCTMTLTLGRLDNRAPFILDSDTDGVLSGPNALVF